MLQATDGRSPLAVCPFDHHDNSTVGDDYYSMYEQLRGQRVSWSPLYGGFWLVADYADARAVLKDHGTFSSASGCFLPDMGYRSVALEQDPPEHDAFRKLFVAGVGRTAVLRYEPELRAMIDRVVGEFAAAGGGDGREAISEKVPVEAIALMYGLSPDAAGRVRELTVETWRRMATEPDAPAVLAEVLLGEAAQRRADPQDDFLTTLTQTEVSGRPLSDAEIANVLVGAVVAGHETTMNASSNLLYELAQNPDLQERLREHPGEIPSTIEECLRHRAPIHLFFRTATHDVSIADAEISSGDKVAVLYAAANRDPSIFSEPDQFMPDRGEGYGHLSFGWGIHRCVGSFLAQTELRILTEALLAAGTIRPDGAAEMKALEGGHHMGFRRLPLKLQRRSGARASSAVV